MKIRKPNLLLFAALTLLCFSCSANDHKAQPVTQPYGMKALPYTTAVEVVWPAQEGTSRYEVQYTEGTDFTAATAREVTGEKLLVEGLKPDTEYSVRVRAAAGSDWTDWSVTKTVTTYSLEISVGTFNLLGATYTFKGPWDVRKGPAGRLILNDAFFPDILGTQETANEQQMNDMIAMLREHYDYRAGEHETMSAHLVFWKRERFELVEAEDVDMMGDNYPGKYLTSRYANYVRLREKATGNEILVYDIHPRAGNDVETQKLREMTAKGLATAALRKARETNLPVIITGDMNLSLIHI